MAKRLEIEQGMRFGDGSRLEVIREVAPVVSGGQRQRAVECRCDCGDMRVYRLYSLRNGNTRSCGCLASEEFGKGCKTHGGSGLPEYVIWLGIRSRCTNLNNDAWKHYGGRGIKVCEKWQESFEAFLADMGRRPSDEHSIDRFPNNNGDYEPGNCRWATAKEQMRNTRVNYLLEYEGETKCVAEWAEKYGVRVGLLYTRLVKLGWTFEEAVGRRAHVPQYTDGFYKTPLKERGAGWQQEHARREEKRILLDRQELKVYGASLAKLHRLDASEFVSRVDASLVDGWTRKGAVYIALKEMGAVEQWNGRDAARRVLPVAVEAGVVAAVSAGVDELW